MAGIMESEVELAGAYVDAPAHTTFLVLDATSAAQIEEALAPVINIGWAETRPVGQLRGRHESSHRRQLSQPGRSPGRADATYRGAVCLQPSLGHGGLVAAGSGSSCLRSIMATTKAPNMTTAASKNVSVSDWAVISAWAASRASW